MNTLDLLSFEISSTLFTETLTYETGGYGGVGYYHGNIASASFSYYSGGSAAYQTLYQYDNLGRLKIEDNNLTALNPFDISNISYDGNGNIISINKGGTNYTYNYYTETNKLKNTVGSAEDYIYDANGNITTSIPKGLNPIAYDPFTQMTKSITVSGTPNKMMSFQYSADNERILKNERQGTTNNNSVYIRGNSDYPITEKANLNNNLTDRIYIYGVTGLIAFKDATATYYVIKDHLGSTRILFRSTGSQYTTYDYSPFGTLMRSSINGDTDYGFTGQEYDNETGLWNFRARLYDDEVGIFYAVDPSTQGFSPFSYCANNPVIFKDKNGRWFGLDDLFVAVTSFVYGYFSHAISTGEWGGQALTSGAISAGVSWLAYNTGGAAASIFFDDKLSAGYQIVSSTVGSTVGGFTGNTLNQIRYTGKVDWNQSLNAGISGSGGGLLGGLADVQMSNSFLGNTMGYHLARHIYRSTAYEVGSHLIGGNFDFSDMQYGLNASAMFPAVNDVIHFTSPLWSKNIVEAKLKDYIKSVLGTDEMIQEVTNPSVDLSFSLTGDGIEFFRVSGTINVAEGTHTFIYPPLGIDLSIYAKGLTITSELGYGWSQSGIPVWSNVNTFNNYFFNYLGYWR